MYRSNKHIDIKGRYFRVPSFTPAQKAIPFARVNHNKYIVTDQSAMIGTSNWTPDYFLKTGGIGFIFSSNSNTKEYQHDYIATFILKHNKYPRFSKPIQSNVVESENQIHGETNIENMHTQLSNVFLRDWNSLYASEDL